MPKKAVSVTLDEVNLTWLRGRARVTARGNLSEAIDRLVTEARTGGGQSTPVRSVAGTVRLPADDLELKKAKAAVRALFEASLARPLLVREGAEPYGRPERTAHTRNTRRTRRG